MRSATVLGKIRDLAREGSIRSYPGPRRGQRIHRRFCPSEVMADIRNLAGSGGKGAE